MSRRTVKPGLLVTLVFAWAFSPAQDRQSQGVHWPSFRGENAGGTAEGFSLPTAWDVQSSKNVRWKTPIPGMGLSSPVVWENRIYLSTAIGGQKEAKLKTGLYGDIASVSDDTVHRWIVYCIDKKTGRIVWEQTAHSGVPQVKRHTKSTHANSTLATDGKHVVAFFGSEGLYCYDMDGRLLWSKNFGLLDSGFFTAQSAQWEFGSSPIIFEDMVIVQCDVQEGSFLAALRIRDGGQIWRTSRDDVPTWGTPAVYASGRNAQVIVNGYRHIGGYDARMGKELWKMRGGGDIPVPTPVVFRDMAFITNAHGPMAPIYAIRLNATGDISLQGEQSSGEHVAWSYLRDGSYMGTPLVYGEHLYNCRWNGVLSCYSAGDGTRHYQERLGEGASAFTASPVAAAGKIYITGEDGDVYVIQAGPAFQLLARNSLDEACLATPAISEGNLIFRTQGHLLAISQNP
ncbi:MAG: PQQ-binding-like beta-propeller repeat protein [Acidobacteriota bacterium]